MDISLNYDKVNVSCSACSLSEICLPRGFTNEEMEEMDELDITKKIIRRGQYLYRVGDPLTALYAIRSGSFKTGLLTADGAEQVTGFFLSGELLGLDGFGDEIHHCNAVALDTCSVCELHMGDFEELCGKLNGVRRNMMHLMGDKIIREQQMLLTVTQMNVEQRIATFLLSLSSRFHSRGFSKQEFNLSMTRQDIANYLGLAPETLSRALSGFDKQGLIRINRRNVKILDDDELRSTAHFECDI